MFVAMLSFSAHCSKPQTVHGTDTSPVSPYLTDVLIAGDELELRGPIGSYFTWEAKDGGPFLLVAGGSGLVGSRGKRL